VCAPPRPPSGRPRADLTAQGASRAALSISANNCKPPQGLASGACRRALFPEDGPAALSRDHVHSRSERARAPKGSHRSVGLGVWLRPARSGVRARCLATEPRRTSW
jgi:hypothetical protein